MTLSFLDHLRAESARFSAVLRDVAPSTRVPTCPDWDAADLAWHLLGVHHFWNAIVAGRLASEEDAPEPPPRPDDYGALIDLGVAATATLAATLAETPEDTSVWTWSTDHSAGFVRRRMAQEALVHRLDAELTAGSRTDLDPALAADGVSEAFEHFFGGWPSWASFTMDGPVGALRATDLDRTWLVQLGRYSGTTPSGHVCVDEDCAQLVDDGTPQFELAAPVGDLEAWAWHRPTLAPVSLTGDRAALARLTAMVEGGID